MTTLVDSASQRTNSINERTNLRNLPSKSMQPYFDSKPVNTKYNVFPIVDIRKNSSIPIINYGSFNIEETFNPGTSMAPWSGFSSNINTESILRNQIYSLQKCSQSIYIPKSKSDLYEVHWQQNKMYEQPFPNLFKNETFDINNPNPNSDKIGFSMFNNATRQQNKNI
jgi:hypothetical protein